MDEIVKNKEVEVVITLQAQKVLASSKYSIEEFLEWRLKTNKISFGGNDATLFLEKMYDKNILDKGGD